MTSGPGDVTLILRQIARGDRSQEPRLFTILYDELHRVAVSYLRQERSDHTLQPTALINEVYLRLIGADDEWANRRHFVSVAARAMRHILIDYARSCNADKRMGNRQRAPLEDFVAVVRERPIELIALDEALRRLEALDPDLARIIELRYFAGQTTQEIAREFGVSVRKIQTDWEFARAWLHKQMSGDDPS